MRARLALALALAGCGTAAPPFVAVTTAPLAEALLSVAGRSARDVWAVGGDAGQGPIALHYDGAAWTRTPTGTRGALWWVHAFADGTAYAAGVGATILGWDGETWRAQPTPGGAEHTVFGVWGRSPSEAYAVGAVAGHDGFVWRRDGERWTEVAVPIGEAGAAPPALFKVCGEGDDVWIVGARGTVLRSRGGGPFARLDGGADRTLFTVAASGSLVVAVGGAGLGAIVEGLADGASLADVTPPDAGLLQGVSVRADGAALASGTDGALYERRRGAWARTADDGFGEVQSFHAAWLDPDGGAWAAGGNALSPALDGGVLVHRGDAVAPYAP